MDPARAAVVAAVARRLDPVLATQATILHDGAARLTQQQGNVAAGVAGLRKSNDGVAGVLSKADKGIKELGDLENWAEVLDAELAMLEGMWNE